MARLLNKETGQYEEIPQESLVEAAGSGIYEIPEDLQVSANLAGMDVTTPLEDVAGLGAESRLSSTEELYEQARRAEIEERTGSLPAKILTGAEGVASGLSGGITDLAAEEIAGPKYARQMRERARENKGVRLVGEIGGALLPGAAALKAGKALSHTPGGLAIEAGKRVGSKKGLAAGMAAEGAIQGFGEGVRDLGLSEDPVTLERAVNALGGGVLMGAATGYGLGVFGKALGKGLQKAKNHVDDAAKASLSGGKITSASDDAFRAVDDLKAYRASDIDPMSLVDGSQKKVLLKQSKSYTSMLDDATGLAERPSSMLKPLRKEAQVLRETMEGADDILAKAAKKDAALAKKLDKLEELKLAGDDARAYAQFRGRRLTRKSAKEGIKVGADHLEEFKQALLSGQVAESRASRMARIPELIEQNENLQRQVLGVIEAGKAGKGGGGGFIQKAGEGAIFSATMTAAAPLGPLAPLAGGAVAKKVGDLVFGRIANASAASAKRVGKALDLFMKAGKPARRAAVPVAVKALSEASFGVPGDTDKTPSAGSLHKAYRARESELLNQVQAGPTGLEVRPQVREKIYDNLSGVRALSPQVADQMETAIVKKTSFLASKLPKRPDTAAMGIGPTRWRPSDMAMRQFGRYVAAANDIPGIFERAAQGNITPEDGETARALAPMQLAEFQQQVQARAQELRDQLPYEKRLALSILTGVPVDPAMAPNVLEVLQGNFVEEPGEGAQAPTANPQFGSVSKPEPTPGQSRAG